MYERKEEDREGLGVVIDMYWCLSHLTQTKQYLCKEKGDKHVYGSCSFNCGRDELVCGSCSFSDNARFNVGSFTVVAAKNKGQRRKGLSARGPKWICVLIYEKNNIGFFKITDVNLKYLT